jgi:hypothetical protein
VGWPRFPSTSVPPHLCLVYDVFGTFVEVEPRDLSTVSRVFFGSHNNYVTDAEADALVAAGYSVLPGVFELDSVYSSSLDSSATLGN